MNQDLDLSKQVFYESSIKAYLAARLLIASNYLSPVGIYNAHLSVECLLKSLIAQSGEEPATIHDLSRLNEKLHQLTSDESLRQAEYVATLEWLNPFQELGRYGALARPRFDGGRVETDTLQARGVVAYQPSEDIKRVDTTFALLRGKSDLQNDVVSQVISSQNTFVNAQWNLPLSIRDVLMSENDSIS